MRACMYVCVLATGPGRRLLPGERAVPGMATRVAVVLCLRWVRVLYAVLVLRYPLEELDLHVLLRHVRVIALLQIDVGVAVRA